MNYQFEFYYSNIKATGSLGNGGIQKMNHFKSQGEFCFEGTNEADTLGKEPINGMQHRNV